MKPSGSRDVSITARRSEFNVHEQQGHICSLPTEATRIVDGVAGRCYSYKEDYYCPFFPTGDFMAAATIWKGMLKFGEIKVPVKLHSAVRDDRIQFHLLHQSDQERLRQQMFCAHEKTAVPADEQVKGYELEKGKYIIIDPAELEQTAPGTDRSIEVHQFVKTADIEPHLVERTYYLAPDGQGADYQTLVDTLNSLEAAAICTWSMRKRSYFGAVMARGAVLRLHTLRYADEAVSVAELAVPTAVMTEKELDIGAQLIDQMTTAFEPQKFVNEHQKKLQAMIDRKIRGEHVVIMPSRRLRPTLPDKLLETLEASLKKAA